jgi:hypothetical protein
MRQVFQHLQRGKKNKVTRPFFPASDANVFLSLARFFFSSRAAKKKSPPPPFFSSRAAFVRRAR